MSEQEDTGMTIDGQPVAAQADIKFEADDPELEAVDESPEGKSDEDAPAKPDGEDKPEEEEEWRPQFDEKEQAFFNSKMAEQHARLSKRYEPMQQELEQLREQVQRMQPAGQQQGDPQRPQVPPVPEWDDDEYDAKMQARDNAMREAAVYDAINQSRQFMQQQQQEAQQRAYVDELTKDVQAYNNKAKRAGITEAELKMAGSNVIPEIHPDITRRLFKDDSGAQIVRYLNNNPGELDKLKGMDILDGWMYVQGTLKAKATTKPVSKTPAPAERVEGGGYPGDPFGAKAAGMVIK